ncbi:MAG: type II toxin-antitoxin system PrlF family antitoxin [Acidobacteriaceae bacterium]|nr:type II toxin-antitoxin system PrlF family antitoxin [Acidobacteriaceae bacterium]
MESALSIKGQATIPKRIRDHLQLRPGDRIKFFLHPDGTVVILPKIPASRLKGIVSSAKDADARRESGKETRSSSRGAPEATAAVLRGFLKSRRRVSLDDLESAIAEGASGIKRRTGRR